MIGVKMVPTSRAGGHGDEAGTALFGEEQFHYTTVGGTHTRKRPESKQLTRPPRLAALFLKEPPHNGHIRRFSATCAVPKIRWCGQSATLGAKKHDANFLILAMRHGFVTSYISFVMIFLMAANDGRTS
jgi:hypothetical protein